MSDPRFARLKTDPRFRKPRKQESRVVVDDRFKAVFAKAKLEKSKGKKQVKKVDKYGRPISETRNEDDLRRFYRLQEKEDGDVQDQDQVGPDYARGEGLLESSDEESDLHEPSDDDESDSGNPVTLGQHRSKPINVQDIDADIDLDEDNFADLDAQAAAYNNNHPAEENTQGEQTRRIAVVNLDWDHVRATHLFKIFSSLLSTTAPAAVHSNTASSSRKAMRGAPSSVARGKVIRVQVYTSEFGKTRLAREETEGPPAEIFKSRAHDDEDVDEQNIYDVGDENDYDEDALRKYQLERLRYYYAIVTCDTVEAAVHVYEELDGTELERSANVFDLSFVPTDMTFEGPCRDEAFADVHNGYRNVDYVTDALRHSKVKLTWDEDDPERNQVTRRTLTRQEIEDADFKAYIASSSSGESDSDAEEKPKNKKKAKAASRDKLRALLLGGGDDDMPEGWGEEQENPEDVDMQITFTPGLSKSNVPADETTLDKYQRKMKEKRRKRKDEVKEKAVDQQLAVEKTPGDDFFDGGSGDEQAAKSSKSKHDQVKVARERPLSTPEELALLVSSDNPNAEPKHFNLKSVIKAEKKTKGKGKKQRKNKGDNQEDNEVQEDFSINVQDSRFKALHEDHTFAIDPTNPHFKKTKSMSALLDERTKRQNTRRGEGSNASVAPQTTAGDGERSLQNLVESVKRKSAAAEKPGTGKRQKL